MRCRHYVINEGVRIICDKAFTDGTISRALKYLQAWKLSEILNFGDVESWIRLLFQNL